MSAASRRQSRNGMAPHDHPLPSGCAFSLRIDGRREGGYGAPQPPEPPRRGSTARADKESLSAPSASEPADGRARAESRGILIFPLRTTPRRGRRGRRARPAGDRWLESAFPLFPPGNRACGRPCTVSRSRMRPAPQGQGRPAERCPPGALPAVPPPGAPFVAHGRLRGGDGHDGPILLFPMCDYPPGSPGGPGGRCARRPPARRESVRHRLARPSGRRRRDRPAPPTERRRYPSQLHPPGRLHSRRVPASSRLTPFDLQRSS